jgi:hypothetical protein
VYLAARDVEPQPDGLPTNQGMTKQAYTVTVVDLTTGHRTQLAKAGACLCLGWPAPTVTWSPDGTTIAYAKTGSHPGIYLVPAHGGKPTILYASRIGTTLAWQPLNE